MNSTNTYVLESDTPLVKPANTMSRKIIINVDDLGMSEPVNNAVVQLAKKRLISASSYMVGGSISLASIKSLDLYNIDIGLHLDFTGLFATQLPNSLKCLIKLSSLRRLDAQTVSYEIKQQLDQFEDTFNHAPRFIDGHQHVHQFAIIRDCLLKELIKRYRKPSHMTLAEKNSSQTTIPSPVNIASRITKPLNYGLKAWIIYSMGGYQWKKMCHQYGIATNTHFGGVYNFDADSVRLTKLWQHWLSRCPLGISSSNKQIEDNPVSVIMCHPAIPDNNWNDEIKQTREREYQWMMSGKLEQLYNQHQVELVHWQDI